MRISLQWRTEGLAPSVVHLTGSVIRVGRNPELECAVPEAMSKGVSWHHLTIELTSGGASVIDVGSSNGTFLNQDNDPIAPQTPTPIKIGDRLGLGQAGPTLNVLAIEGVATPARGPEALRTPVIGIALVGAAIVLVLGVLGAVWLLSRANQVPEQGTEHAGAATAKVAPPVTEPPKPKEQNKKPPDVQPPPIKPPTPPTTEDAPEIGQYVEITTRAPGILLQRGGEGQTWTVLRGAAEKRRGDRVVAESELVSLPGYVNAVDLDDGVRLELWGNLPEFSQGQRESVRESTVVLHKPGKGMQADLTLLGGRIVLANQRGNQPVTLRLEFHREPWNVVLANDKALLAVEGLTLASPKGGGSPVRVLWFFSQGDVKLTLNERAFALPPSGHLAWSEIDGPTTPSRLTQLPAWWVKPIKPDEVKGQPVVVETLLHLDQWEKYLSKSGNNVADTIRTKLKEKDQDTEFPRFRALGLYFLASVNHEVLATAFLDDRHPRVRDASGDILRSWLQRSKLNEAALTAHLKANGVGEPKIKLLVRLLVGIGDADLKDQKTINELLDLLDHENLEIRHLALRLLIQVAPKEAQDIRYDPADDSRDRRVEAIKAWREIMKSKK